MHASDYIHTNKSTYFIPLFVRDVDATFVGFAIEDFHSMYCYWPCVLLDWKLVQTTNVTTCSCPQSQSPNKTYTFVIL